MKNHVVLFLMVLCFGLVFANHFAQAHTFGVIIRVIGECENSKCEIVKTGNLSYEPATEKEIQALEKSLSNAITMQSHGVYQLTFFYLGYPGKRYEESLEDQAKYGTIGNLKKLEFSSVDDAFEYYIKRHNEEVASYQRRKFYKQTLAYIFTCAYILLSLVILYRRLFSAKKKTEHLVLVKFIIIAPIIVFTFAESLSAMSFEFYVYEAIILTELIALAIRAIAFFLKKSRIA